MLTLKKIREQYPEKSASMSDEQLANMQRSKNYPDMSIDEFNNQFYEGMETPRETSRKPPIDIEINRGANSPATMNNGEGNPSLLQKAGNLAGNFNETVEGLGIPNFGAGVFQGAIDPLVSLANIPLKSTGYQLPHPNFESLIPEKNRGNGLMFRAGELGGALVPGLNVNKIIDKLLGAGHLAKGAPGVAEKIGKKALSGGITGALTGEIGDDKDNKFLSEANPNSRKIVAATGAALGGLAFPAAKLTQLAKYIGKTGIKGGKSLVKNLENLSEIPAEHLSSEYLAKHIPEVGFSNQRKNSKMFEDIKKAADESGLTNILPKNYYSVSPRKQNLEPRKYEEFVKNHKIDIDLKNDIEKAARKDLKGLMRDFYSNPTFDNAHRLQSELFKFQNEINFKIGKGTASNYQQDAGIAAEKLRKRLNNMITKSFEEKGHPDLAKKYKLAQKDYAENVEPYIHNPIIQKLTGKKQKISDKDFADALIRDPDFMKRVGKNHPELASREFLSGSFFTKKPAELLGILK